MISFHGDCCSTFIIVIIKYPLCIHTKSSFDVPLALDEANVFIIDESIDAVDNIGIRTQQPKSAFFVI